MMADGLLYEYTKLITGIRGKGGLYMIPGIKQQYVYCSTWRDSLQVTIK